MGAYHIIAAVLLDGDAVKAPETFAVCPCASQPIKCTAM